MKKIIMASINDEDLKLVNEATNIQQRSRASFIRFAVVDLAKQVLHDSDKNVTATTKQS